MQPLSYRILSNHLIEGSVEEGELVVARVDLVVMNDVTAPLAFRVMDEAGVQPRVRVDVFLDHYAPPPSIEAARIHASLRRRARRGLCILHEVGEGVMHQVAVEELVEPGSIVVGADSHTPTYGALASFAVGVGSSEAAYAAATGTLWFRVPRVLGVRLEGRLEQPVTGKDVALHMLREIPLRELLYTVPEFNGPGLQSLSIADRLTIANMLVEGGVKTSLFPIDAEAEAFLGSRAGDAGRLETYNGADYTLNLSAVEPMIAEPPTPLDAKPVSELEGVEVDQVFIGSCTNGRLEDMEAAARILKGRKAKTRLIVTPASRRVFEEALRRGYIHVLVEAGAMITPPGCGLCFGAHMGLLADDEVMVSTANRNFPGRCGARTAKVYLANPYTAAAAAVTGRITDPRSLLGAGGGRG